MSVNTCAPISDGGEQEASKELNVVPIRMNKTLIFVNVAYDRFNKTTIFVLAFLFVFALSTAYRQL